MDDKELLENAAKAAGIKIGNWIDFENVAGFASDEKVSPWNPLTDDGDCARMEAMLGIDVEWRDRFNEVACSVGPVVAACDYTGYGCKQAARRLASLRVAAEIGRAV